MKPSDFVEFPSSSVLQKFEPERIAQNIMIILKRTGDTFRPLDWHEYTEERLKDGQFSEGEKQYFDKVIGYCKSEDTAKLFSEQWNKS